MGFLSTQIGLCDQVLIHQTMALMGIFVEKGHFLQMLATDLGGTGRAQPD